MAKLILLGPARDVAGQREAEFDGATVVEVLEQATLRFGSDFKALLAVSQVWLHGEPAQSEALVAPHDEIMVLPPVSGG